MQNVNVPQGKYIIAVSGGVDSMVLLDILRQKNDIKLIVVHVGHGMRSDSDRDEASVRVYAKKYNLPFIVKRLHLPTHTSEEAARKARYAFLHHCRKMSLADGIIVAHHQDDLIETVIINYMRGTKWRGLAPFSSNNEIIRPLLNMSKDDLIAYARKHRVLWREDSSNVDEQYLRNYVRRTVIPTLDQKSDTWRTTLLQHIRRQQSLRNQIEDLLTEVINKKTGLSRYMLIMMPQEVAIEIIQQMLRQTTGSSVVQKLAESALLFTKVAFPSKIMPINHQWQFRVTTRQLIVEPSRDMIR